MGKIYIEGVWKQGGSVSQMVIGVCVCEESVYGVAA